MRFLTLVFSWISLPPAPEYTISAISNFLRKFAEKFAAHGPPPDIVAIICHRCRHWHWWQLSPLSPTLTKMVAKFVSLIPVENLLSLILAANLPSVSFIPVVHLDLQISPRIFGKIWNGSNGYKGSGGKIIHEKNHKQKISWHCPFKGTETLDGFMPIVSSLWFSLRIEIFFSFVLIF